MSSARISPRGLGAEFQRLGDSALSPGELLAAAADRIAQVIPHDGCCISSADPGTLVLVDTWTAGIPAEEFATAFYESEHGPPDYASHTELVAGGGRAAILGALTRGDPTRSARFRRLLAPMGIEHELRAAALDNGAPWAFLHLYRRRGRRDFDADELAAVRRAAPMLAAAFRAATARRSNWPAAMPSPAPASAETVMILVDRRLRIVGHAGPAPAWLTAMQSPRSRGQLLPVAVMSVVSAALLDAPPKPVRTITQSGDWWVLNAARFVAPGHVDTVAVTAVPARGAALTDVLMLILGLTPGERKVCELVLDGASTKVVAQSLGLSSFTVQDRLKAIFAKAQVGSRGQLAAALRA